MVFLVKPQFFYWHTQGLSNYRFPDGRIAQLADQVPPTFAAVTRFEFEKYLRFRNLGDLPEYLRGLTHAQIVALANLDPFIRRPGVPRPKGDDFDLGPGNSFLLAGDFNACSEFDGLSSNRCISRSLRPLPLDSSRFSLVGNFCTPVQVNHTSGQSGTINALNQKSLSDISKMTPSGTLNLLVKGSAFVGEKVAKALGAGFSAEDIESTFKTVVYSDQSETTVTTTLRRNEAIDETAGTAFTQSFFFKEKTDPRAVMAVYYDKVFGTMAFRALPACGGTPKQAFMTTFPGEQLVQEGSGIKGEQTAIVLSQANKDYLASLGEGPLSFVIAPREEYDVAQGEQVFQKGFPSGMTLNATTGAVTGTATTDTRQQFQALVYAMNGAGERVAGIWYDLNIALDSDGDGIPDFDEINVYHTDPFNPDTDGDGLRDGDEINDFGTDPTKSDTDGDGVADGRDAFPLDMARSAHDINPILRLLFDSQ